MLGISPVRLTILILIIYYNLLVQIKVYNPCTLISLSENPNNAFILMISVLRDAHLLMLIWMEIFFMDILT